MKKVTEEQFQMLATQFYIFVFGISFGWFVLFPTLLWWVPVALIILLIIARWLISKVDEKEDEKE